MSNHLDIAAAGPFLVAATCAVLTLLGFFLSPVGLAQSLFVNRSIVLTTLALTSLLVWQEKQTRSALMWAHEKRTRAEAELIALAATLEQRVVERTAELHASRAAGLNSMEDNLEASKQSERTEHHHGIAGTPWSVPLLC